MLERTASDDLSFASLTEVSDLIARREVSPVALTKQLLEAAGQPCCQSRHKSRLP